MTSNWWRAHGVVLLALITVFAKPAADPTPRLPPAAIGAQTPETLSLLLAEVRFDPRPGDTAFVELLNAGPTPVDLLRFVLRVGGSDLPLPRLADSLAPDARLVVRFDGSGRTEKSVVHAAANYTIAADSGSIELLRDDRLRLDRVAWGTSSDPVALGDGGFVHSTLQRGGSIGRPPGANAAGAITDWVVYPPAQVTPGRPNPLPAVGQLLPLDGVIIEDTTVNLAWYPVPGAARYRVQVAADSIFARPAVDQTVTVPELPAARLALGAYVWRVQAIDARGNGAAWSDLSVLERAAPGDAPGPPEPAGDGPNDGTAEESRRGALILPVPYLTQHKDTKMLLLEEEYEKGPHAWDVDHRYPSRVDPADTKNCALANIAMVNHFFGGDLSQDRIGYEVLSRNVTKYVGPVGGTRATSYLPGTPTTFALGQAFGGRLGTILREVQPGPERDLNYGQGLDIFHTVAAMAFAMGAPPDVVLDYGTKDQFWSDVVSELKGGRPVVGANWRHAFVIKGFEQRGRRRFIYVNDPANGQQRIDIDAGRIPASQLSTFKFLSTPKIARQEPEVTQDGDGDGVVDFDELERFKTNPMNQDTDADGVHDKQDIRAGVFEVEFGLGYALHPGPPPNGRDFDDDGLPTELDADSDWPAGGNAKGVSDGCLDGDEDKNGDGIHDASETNNFNPSDDKCARLRGTITYSVAMDNPTPESIARSIEETVVVHVSLKPDPNGSPEQYIDDGSTFSAHATGHIEIDTGDPKCTIWAMEWFSASGSFSKPNDLVAGTRGDSTLVVGAQADRPSHTFANVCTLGSGQGDSEHAVKLGECEGKLSQTQVGQRTFIFDCTTKPTPGLGWNVSRYFIKGFVRVR